MNNQLMSIIEYNVREFLDDYKNIKVKANGYTFNSNTLASNIFHALDNDLRSDTVYFPVQFGNDGASSFVIIKKYDYNMVYFNVTPNLDTYPSARNIEFRTYKNRLI